MSVDLLAMSGVHKSFRRGFRKRVPALQGVDLRVGADKPQIITIAGESGSGKSTLGMLALGFLAADAGTVRYRGQDVGRLRGSALREFRRSVQAIFQNPFTAFNPFYPVDHVLRLTLRNFAPSPDRADEDAKTSEALRALRLDPDVVLGKYPHQLSGGQLQRVMLARAFLLRPKLIIADEPVSMIDASLRALVLANMLELKERYGISQLYLTHDLSTARQISDFILILYRGRIVEAGRWNRSERASAPLHAAADSGHPPPGPDAALAEATRLAARTRRPQAEMTWMAAVPFTRAVRSAWIAVAQPCRPCTQLTLTRAPPVISMNMGA